MYFQQVNRKTMYKLISWTRSDYDDAVTLWSDGRTRNEPTNISQSLGGYQRFSVNNYVIKWWNDGLRLISFFGGLEFMILSPLLWAEKLCKNHEWHYNCSSEATASYDCIDWVNPWFLIMTFLPAEFGKKLWILAHIFCTSSCDKAKPTVYHFSIIYHRKNHVNHPVRAPWKCQTWTNALV